MSWQDRLREAAYTSPSGVRVVFDYENVRREIDKKTAAFEFSDAEGTYIQDLGRSGRRYPLRLFFSGADHDRDAQNFDALLLESGIGKLEHPIYGSINVVPFGTIVQRDDLKTAANQSVFEVTFWETLNEIYPVSQIDSASEVSAAVDAFNDDSAEKFNSVVDLERVTDQVVFRNRYLALIDSVQARMRPIVELEDQVRRSFETVVESVQNGVDVLIANPLTLAFQTSLLIQAPARSTAAISDRLEAYSDLANALIQGDGAVVSDEVQFYTNDLFAASYVSGSVLSLVSTDFDTRNSAIESAEALIEQFENLYEWQESNYSALGLVDTGQSYQKLQESVALATGFLIEISFSLRQEKRLVLGRNRTIVDLVGELYGAVDSQLDFFINSNNLSGSEILEIPRGREVVYYV